MFFFAVLGCVGFVEVEMSVESEMVIKVLFVAVVSSELLCYLFENGPPSNAALNHINSTTTQSLLPRKRAVPDL